MHVSTITTSSFLFFSIVDVAPGHNKHKSVKIGAAVGSLVFVALLGAFTGMFIKSVHRKMSTGKAVRSRIRLPIGHSRMSPAYMNTRSLPDRQMPRYGHAPVRPQRSFPGFGSTPGQQMVRNSNWRSLPGGKSEYVSALSVPQFARVSRA